MILSPQPGIPSTNDRLSTIGNLKFREDIRDVVADGVWTESQTLIEYPNFLVY